MGNYALWIVLIMTLALTFFGNQTRRNLYQAELEGLEAFNVNQAKNISQAVMLAISNQLNDSVFVSSTNDYQDWDAMGGSYRYGITAIGDTLLVESWGKVGSSEYKQELKLLGETGSTVWSPIIPYAVFSGSSITLTGSAKIKGDAGTNASGAGDVNLSWSTSIDSSLMIGPGADPSTTVFQASGKNVGQGILNLPYETKYTLPKFIEYPAKTKVLSSITTTWKNNNLVLNPSDYDGSYIPSITVASGYTINIDTGSEDRVLHVGDFLLKQGRVNILGTGNLTLIVENELTVSGSSVMNPSENYEQLFTYYEGANELSFAGSTKFYGNLYAKTADITIGGSGGIKGHIITGGSNVKVTGGSSANTRILFAPNAHVSLTGSGAIKGAVVANSFSAVGGTKVEFSSSYNSSIPELEVESAANGYSILYWY